MLFYGFAFSLILVLINLKPKFQDFRNKSKQLWAEVKSYGIHIYISNIWHEILFHGDKFVISYYLDDNAMAYYALGYMITFPLSHFSTSLSTTLFNKFISQNKIRGRDLKVNILFIAVSVSIIIFFRRFIIVYLFSEKYLPTIDVILPLALAFGLAGLSKPLTMFLMAHGHGKIVRNISVTVTLSQLALNIAFVPVFGIIGAGWIATFIYGLDLFLVYFFYNKIVRSI
jgi:O-antigen/teichoic acid export membrane protein